ncbi:MAG: LytTR family DNA-binding domain-containing protein [Bacteroidota bacterium]|nr:LytTR family DNA-binding domain-containing protein [Bacteroidota bacterium]MDP3144911.1 LytTR family DNA-binding domain-containing protein [Bacteroidota bacterium]
MIKALIVDDEEKSRVTLNSLLTMYCPTVEVIDLCDSVNSALISIANQKPDLVFLDVEMPFHNGFTLLEKIKNPKFEVIFTTAYDHYAIKAIKYSALDYLLKPIDSDDLKAAIAKVEGYKPSSAISDSKFELLLSNLKVKGNNAKIAVPTFEGLQMVNAADIIKCSADESYTHITLINNTKITVSRLLKEYEELLSDLNFFRVHNSSLINLAHVTKYIKGEGGYVVMSDGSSVEVSRRKKNELLSKLSLVQM